MTDTYTSTTDDSGPGLTLDMLIKAKAELDALLPRLLYHTTDYMPVLDLEGNPMVIKVSPSKMDAHMVRDAWEYLGFEDYLLIHPDNLPQLRRACAGLYRLEPLVDVNRKPPAKDGG